MTEERIEQVARALCKLDGKEPNEQRQTGRMIAERLHNGSSLKPETEPQWHAYRKEAARLVAAFDVLQGN